jgi:hypothetical protein
MKPSGQTRGKVEIEADHVMRIIRVNYCSKFEVVPSRYIVDGLISFAVAALRNTWFLPVPAHPCTVLAHFRYGQVATGIIPHLLRRALRFPPGRPDPPITSRPLVHPPNARTSSGYPVSLARKGCTGKSTDWEWKDGRLWTSGDTKGLARQSREWAV